jgi:hypothetical protein
MKNLIWALMISMAAMPSFAKENSLTPEQVEICAVETEEATMTVSDSQNVTDLKRTLSAFEVFLLNQHLLDSKYAEKSLSLTEIIQEFSTGDRRSDELHIVYLKGLQTGKTYIEVYSYPGDNQYGLLFDLEGNILARNEDGSYSIETPNGQVYCYDSQN